MSDATYKIVFTGNLKDGVTPQQARESLMKAFKLSEERVERYFTGKPVVLKKGISREQADKFQTVFEKVGLQVETEILKPALELEPKLEVQAGNEPEPENESESTAKNSQNDSGEINPYQTPASSDNISPNESQERVFCRKCGEQIGDRDEFCPACGQKQIIGHPRSKVKAALFAWFLGFFGVHRFYLGQWWGIFYFIFGILSWPITIIEGFVFILTSEEKWQEKYGNVLGVGKTSKIFVVVIMSFVIIAVLGILAAIAVPAYVDYQIRAKVAMAEPLVTESRQKVENEIRRLNFNFIPNSNLDAGLPDVVTGPNIRSILVKQNGVVEVIYSAPDTKALDGESVIWTPVVSDGRISWDCNGGSLPERHRSSTCKQSATGLSQTQQSLKLAPGGTSGQQNLVHRISSDLLYELGVPRAWTKMDDLNEDATLAYARPALEQYIIVIPEAKQDVAGVDFDQYTDLITGGLLGNITNAEMQLLANSRSGQSSIRNYVIHGTTENIDLSFRLAVLEGRSHYFQILAWTLRPNFDESKPQFDLMIDSFRERPPV
jgi:Tfp pilus assembly major pilin PilA